MKLYIHTDDFQNRLCTYSDSVTPVLTCNVNNSCLEYLMVQTVVSDWEEFIINKSFMVEIPQKHAGNPLVCLDLCVCGVYMVNCVFVIN